MTRFAVDDVVAADDRLPTRPLGSLFPGALVVGGDPALPVLAPDGVHPLVSAVGRAFAEHRPLVLSPDAIWLTIGQGVAQHLRLSAPPGPRQRIDVAHPGPRPADAASWAGFAEAFSARIDGTEFFACDFSTSTGVERVAGRVVGLDAYSPYFSLWLWFVCGIPSVTLTGTVADWQRIRDRLGELDRFGLGTWRASLVPIADQFVRAAAGDADLAFWQRIYSPADAYGGTKITGWVARFFPYLTGDGVVDRPNPLLDLPIGEPRDHPAGRYGYEGPGVRSDEVPATLSRVVVNFTDRAARESGQVELHGGLVGVAQDADGGLRPVAGWHVTPAEPRIDDVLDRIGREHVVTPPAERQPHFASADLVALYRRVGSATLFGGSWRVRPVAEHTRSSGERLIMTVADLPGGRHLAAVFDDDTETVYWLVHRGDEATAADPIYGTSLAILLDAALDSGGAIGHLRTGYLGDLDGAEITELRRARAAAITTENYEYAAELRDREKKLLSRLARRTEGRAGGGLASGT